jgi:hypothetical protein
MEQAEIAELFYNALIDANKSEQLAQFLSARVKWILSTADPHVGGDRSPPNALKFSGKAGCRQLALYFRNGLKVFSGDLQAAALNIGNWFSFSEQCDCNALRQPSSLRQKSPPNSHSETLRS